MDYRIVDADSHVNEPADVWQPRVPASLRDVAPKMIEVDDGKIGWSFEGGKRVHRVNTSCAGVDETAYTADGVRWDEVRPGSYDPKARLADMDVDMIQAQVLYPSLAPQPQMFGADPELQNACVRAYNDWIHEFASFAPGSARRHAHGPRHRRRRHAHRVAAHRRPRRPRLRDQRLPER